MIRTFQTHYIRREEELTGKLWAFTPLAGEHAGETFPVAVPHYGCALPFAAMAHDLALIRDLGANSVRTAHHEQQGRVRGIPPPKTLRRSREKNIPRNIKTRARG